MRITLINQFYTPDISPTAQLSGSLAEGLARLGHDVTVVASRGGYVEASASASADRRANPRVFRIWTPRLGKKNIVKRLLDYASFYLGAARRMASLPRQDVIIALTTPPYIAWTAVLHRYIRRQTKIVLWNMDVYPDVVELAGIARKGGLLSRVLRGMNRALFRRLDHLICLDTAMVVLLMSQYAPTRKKLPVTVIPNWERAALFPPVPACAGRTWEGWMRLGVGGEFVILYTGNMGVGHEFETVLAAAEKLSGKPVRFLFIGGGKRWKEIEAAKTSRGLDNVLMQLYLVEKSAVCEAMAGADCAMITLSEKMAGVMSPSKLHANLAMGLPILYVGPRRSNVDDAVERFGCGVSLREGDVDGVVNFIERMMSDRAGLGELRVKARGAFEAGYSDMRVLPQFEAVLEGLKRGGRF